MKHRIVQVQYNNETYYALQRKGWLFWSDTYKDLTGNFYWSVNSKYFLCSLTKDINQIKKVIDSLNAKKDIKIKPVPLSSLEQTIYGVE
jgi:hypothetical protein